MNIKELNKRYKKLFEAINTSIAEAVSNRIVQLNFKPLKSNGIKYGYRGTYNHVISFINPGTLNYQIGNTNVIYNNTWQLSNLEDVDNAFNEITKQFEMYE